jgi:Glycine zipper 2TM domain
VSGTNGAVIPAGSKVVLEVASVERGDVGGNGARIGFRVRAVDDGTHSHPATADGSTTGPFEKTAVAGKKGSDAKKVIGGAIAGAILGQMMGKDTRSTVIGAAAGAAAGTAAAKMGGSSESCLPSGTPLKITLDQAVVLK